MLTQFASHRDGSIEVIVLTPDLQLAAAEILPLAEFRADEACSAAPDAPSTVTVSRAAGLAKMLSLGRTYDPFLGYFDRLAWERLTAVYPQIGERLALAGTE